MPTNNLNIWRESASLIILAKSMFAPTYKYNYKILSLKRSLKSNVNPSAYVFPGGNTVKWDHSKNWWSLFKRFGYTETSFSDLYTRDKGQTTILSYEQDLPKFLSLRICAIRETFEECGILLCRSNKIKQNNKGSWASFIGGVNLIEWQHKVHENPEEFLNLCHEYEICPDVWALMTWSHWASPPCLISKFNTLFFLTTLHQRPVAHKDDKEIMDLMWQYPDKYIQNDIKLPIPQFYEISRLKTIKNIEDIAKFAEERAKYGCEIYLPYRVKTKNYVYSILPGDDCYPNFIDKNNSEIDYVEELPEVKCMNRIVHQNDGLKLITKKFIPNVKHLIP